MGGTAIHTILLSEAFVEMSQTLCSDTGLAACEQLAPAARRSATADGAGAPTPLFHPLPPPPRPSLHIGHKTLSGSHPKRRKAFSGRLDGLQRSWGGGRAGDISRRRQDGRKCATERGNEREVRGWLPRGGGEV